MAGRRRCWSAVPAALVLCAVVAVAVLPAGPARGQEADGEALYGALTAEDEPVAGAVVVAVDDEGVEVGRAESDADGEWFLALPGPGVYTATLDEDSLPDDVTLRSEEDVSRELEVASGRERRVVFPLGEEEGLGAVTLERLPQALANGVKFGLIIAMAAIGLSLIFGTTRLINFAHGELVTFGAVVAWFLNAAGLHLVPAAGLAVLAGAGLGGALDRGLWRPLRARQTGIIQMLVITVGLAFVIRNVVLFFFGGGRESYFDYALQSAVRLGPVRMTPRDLVIMALSVAVLALVGLALTRTRLGKALRAVADNSELAEATGIDVQRIILLVWVVGGGLTALGGVLLGSVETVEHFMGFRLLLLMFAGVILGGLGTAYGAAVGSLVVGIVTEVSTVWFSTEVKEMWALLILILILLFRPQGILGYRERVG